MDNAFPVRGFAVLQDADFLWIDKIKKVEYG